MTLAERITALREAAGLTQAELARRCEVDRRLPHAWEQGYCRPGITTLPRLAEVLGVTVDKLLRPELATTPESYCACGRRLSECDGSRKGCGRRTNGGSAA